MKILLKHVFIADSHSPHNNSYKDVLITNGFFEKIDTEIENADEIIQFKDLTVSPGWIDIFTHGCDPGYEYKETLETLAAAAASGGFTRVFTIPDTNPPLQNKAQVDYIIQKSKQLRIFIHPLGAITKNCEGNELAEMYDMEKSGAIAFTDGINAVQSSAIFLKALQYVKAIDKTLIQIPFDKSIGQYGLMNEGIMSTQLGLPGTPAIAEEMMIIRDLKLVKHAQSKLHFTGVSTAASLKCIQEAKEQGLQVTCSVTPYHLFFCDEDLESYDSNLKVNPPLRSRNDMMALREGVISGMVDCIASHHIPQDWDSKTCEFEYAKNGMIGLQTSFAAVNTVLPQLSKEAVVKLFSENARHIFQLPSATIQEGNEAEITLFDCNSKYIFNEENNQSKSKNSAFINKTLDGKVVGVFTKGKLSLNK